MCGTLYFDMALNEGKCIYDVQCSVCIYIYVFVSLGCAMKCFETTSEKMKLPVAVVCFGIHLF